jgi:hypothetical protein
MKLSGALIVALVTAVVVVMNLRVTVLPNMISYSSSQNSGELCSIQPQTLLTASEARISHGPTVNVLLCLSGSEFGLLQETAVAIKSLILNAPHTGQLRIYIMADQESFEALPNTLTEALPNGSIWWCPLSIHVLNIEPFVRGWKMEIRRIQRGIDTLHTWGTYFRLFANRILPPDVDQFLYLDPDVIVTANLAHLWHHVTSSNETRNLLFHWRYETAGFLVMRNTAELWKLATQIDRSELPEERFNDQKILKLIAMHYGNRVGELPMAWGIHWAKEWRYRNSFPEQFPQVPMGHFNGGAGSASDPFGTNPSRWSWTSTNGEICFTITFTCHGPRCVSWVKVQHQVVLDIQ